MLSTKRKIAVIVLLTLTALTTIFILINAFLPGDVSSSLSNSFADTLLRAIFNPSDDETFYHFVRKSVGHFALNGINAGLALLTLLTYFESKRENRGYLLLPAFMYGVINAGLSELMQLLAVERFASWIDFGINTLGCLTAVVIIGLVYSIKFTVKRNK